MLYIITKKTDYMLKFFDRNGKLVDQWAMNGDIEEVLYAACVEWCENFEWVEVSDTERHICTMYNDGGIELVASGIPALLD